MSSTLTPEKNRRGDDKVSTKFAPEKVGCLTLVYAAEVDLGLRNGETMDDALSKRGFGVAVWLARFGPIHHIFLISESGSSSALCLELRVVLLLPARGWVCLLRRDVISMLHIGEPGLLRGYICFALAQALASKLWYGCIELLEDTWERSHAITD